MDACKNSLSISLSHQSGDLPDHIFAASAADSASGKGNDTVTAELITAVLNFDKSSCMVGRLFQMKRLIITSMGKIGDKYLCFFFLMNIA